MKPPVLLATGTCLYFPEDIDPAGDLCLQVIDETADSFSMVLYTGNIKKAQQFFTKKELIIMTNKLSLNYCSNRIRRGGLCQLVAY